MDWKELTNRGEIGCLGLDHATSTNVYTWKGEAREKVEKSVLGGRKH